MTASTHIGRVGGLAVALGVGAAILGSSGTAWAGPDSPAPGPSATGSGTGSDAGSAIRKAVKDSLSNVAAMGTRARELGNDTRTNLHDLADNVSAHLTTTTTTTPQQRASRNNTFAVKPPAVTSLPSFGAPRPRLTRAVEAFSSGPIAQNLPETLDSIAAPLRTTLDAGTATNDVAAAVAAAANQILRPFTPTVPSAPPPVVPLTGLTDLVQLAGLRRGLSGAASTLDQPSASEPTPTLVLNGNDIYSTSPEKIVSWYGIFTTPPATPGTVQGVQDFKVVDPESGHQVGTFTALVNNTNAFFLGGGTFQEYVVTESDGAGAPPSGTLIAQNKIGYFGLFGTLYTSTPTGVDGERDISFKLLTPFGDIPIPFNHDAAEPLTAVSTPVELGDGYYIAPAPESPEKGIGITGIAPYFTVYQGQQVFNVYDPDGNVVGSFEGYVATTGDVVGVTTQAILVTKTISVEPGTPPGLVPPAGSVYNVYRLSGADVLYSALPSTSGGPTDITFKLQLPGPLPDIDIPFFWDATKIPTMNSIEVPGQYTLRPVTDLQPIGVNGLPPREVQIQGYQQFDVYDKAGNKIGTVDADVTTQYNLNGTVTESVLVTKVHDVPLGTDPASLPQVGAQYSAISFPVGGIGILYASVPSSSSPKGKNTWSLLTPLGNVNVPFPFYNPLKGLDDVTYANPF